MSESAGGTCSNNKLGTFPERYKHEKQLLILREHFLKNVLFIPPTKVTFIGLLVCVYLPVSFSIFTSRSTSISVSTF